MPSSLSPQPQCRPVLDPEFLPASLWNRAYRQRVDASRGGGQALVLALGRGNKMTSVFKTRILPESDPATHALTRRYVERLTKCLLWQRGGATVIVGGSPMTADHLARAYGTNGPRAFDRDFLGKQLFGQAISVRSMPIDEAEALTTEEDVVPLGRHLEGNRIGFDLGGSDRKAAAVIDGKVVFSEEIPWDPYFQRDPDYHFQGICDSLRRAATHLPSIDAVGGSAAGVYVANEVRGGSLFRGVPTELFETHVRRIFFRVIETLDWQDVPWQVVNDGEVTAFAGSMALNANAVLGISMGTSQAAGYVAPNGNLKPWLNELAFVPIDYRAEAPVDEWSRDRGCGVQYFSQQGVARLAPAAGITFPGHMPVPEQLVEVQKRLAAGDERAAQIFATVGTCFGYAIAQYADFYEIAHLLVLGRVTSGEGGGILLREADRVLQTEFPDLAERISLHTPNESAKRHGQAIAAASLPALKES